MNAKWAVIGVGKSRSWSLTTAEGEVLARIYAGTRYCSYLVQDGQELLFDNTSAKLSDHQRSVTGALHARFKRLEGVFGASASPQPAAHVGDQARLPSRGEQQHHQRHAPSNARSVARRRARSASYLSESDSPYRPAFGGGSNAHANGHFDGIRSASNVELLRASGRLLERRVGMPPPPSPLLRGARASPSSPLVRRTAGVIRRMTTRRDFLAGLGALVGSPVVGVDRNGLARPHATKMQTIVVYLTNLTPERRAEIIEELNGSRFCRPRALCSCRVPADA